MRFQSSLLCPRPRKLEAGVGELSLCVEPRLELGGLDATPAAQRMRRVLQEMRLPPANAESVRFALSLQPGDEQSEAYALDIDVAGVSIRASSPAGLFYGVCTLAQLLELGTRGGAVSLPLLEIEDQPSFARRGVMLDISRDKVPTLATTLALVDLLASLKINELQLYMEHTFAYAGHEKVWQNASPYTGAEIETLDRF